MSQIEPRPRKRGMTTKELVLLLVFAVGLPALLLLGGAVWCTRSFTSAARSAAAAQRTAATAPPAPRLEDRQAAVTCGMLQGFGYQVANCRATGFGVDVLVVESPDCWNSEMRAVLVNGARDHFRTVRCNDTARASHSWSEDLH